MKDLPVIPIKLDKDRKLKMTGQALVNIEDITGLNTLTGGFWEKVNTKDLLVALWQALLFDDPDLEYDDVVAMYHPGLQMYVMEKLFEAWGAAIEAEKKGKKGKAKSKDPLSQKQPEK